jgi:hypothetical protein
VTILSNAKGRLMIFVLALAVVLAICVALFKSTDQKPSGASESVPSQTSVSTAADGPAPNIGALHFASSGRLPTDFHGFRLGSSVQEAIARGPKLTDYHTGGAPSPLNPNEDMYGDDEDGFRLSLSFTRGRLIAVIAQVDNISPEDAVLFNKHILQQLGRPDVEVYSGPSSDDWVWIDQDVRIQYQSSSAPWNPELKGACRAFMELSVYPEMITRVATESGDSSVTDQFVQELKRQWGENPSPPTLKPSPTALGGVQLRMAPWQVRGALPGIQIRSDSESDAQGVLGGNIPTTTVNFWNGQAVSIFTTRKIDRGGILKLRDELLAQFGTPSHLLSTKGTEDITWEDDGVFMDYLFIENPPDGPEVNVWLKDKNLDRQKLVVEMTGSPPKFNVAPPSHSFF